MFTLQIVRGSVSSRDARLSFETKQYGTKRETLSKINETPHSYIRRIDKTYTIYAK